MNDPADYTAKFSVAADGLWHYTIATPDNVGIYSKGGHVTLEGAEQTAKEAIERHAYGPYEKRGDQL